MRRAVSLFVLGVLAALGIVAGVYAPGGGASAVKVSATVKITVNASEFTFVLSRRSVPVGTTVVFTVINTGKIAHDFKIAGQKTPRLRPGKKATLRVVLKKKGRIAYTCTLPGHALVGMKGVFSIGVAPPRPTTVTTMTTTLTTTTLTTTTLTTTTATTATTVAGQHEGIAGRQ